MKDVMLKIKSCQTSEEAGKDEMEFVTEAKMYNRNGAMYLLYEETELSGMPGCRTRLRMRDGEVQLKRFGKGTEGGSEMKFQQGKRFDGLYETEFGPLEFELLTNRLKNSFSEEGTGQLEIDYDISLKGLIEGRNCLQISVM